jgi:pentatricopeptide repeat protein
METFMIAIKTFTAGKERKEAVEIFELMKKYQFKVGVDTINCLLDTLGRAKLGKEAQALFKKLKDRFTHNLQTYTVLLNGWCRVKNLMEAGWVWNEMIDKGFKPDIVAQYIMLEGLLRCRKRSDAIKLFEVMKARFK